MRTRHTAAYKCLRSLTPGLILAVILAFGACTPVLAASEDRLKGLAAVANICVATQIGFFGDVTTIVSSPAVFYRIGTGPWTKSAIELKGHSLSRLPNGNWLLNDTENNRLIELEDISGKGRVVTRSKLAGFVLSRPHDQIVDPKTGDIYVIDGNRRLFRFKDLEGTVEAWTFSPEQMGYDRSLSWFDSHLHIIDSSRGEVVRIDDYSKHHFTMFRSPRPDRANPKPFLSYGERDFMGGSLSATGLILNDVEKAGKWYYGSNMFTREFALGGDPRPARLIRWRSWADFEKGIWEDLTSYLPTNSISAAPYFLTVKDDTLYSPLFHSSGNDCKEGKILQLNLGSLRPE